MHYKLIIIEILVTLAPSIKFKNKTESYKPCRYAYTGGGVNRALAGTGF